LHAITPNGIPCSVLHAVDFIELPKCAVEEPDLSLLARMARSLWGESMLLAL
jgi:hypothetical protein